MRTRARGVAEQRRALNGAVRVKWTLWKLASFIRHHGYCPSAPVVAQELGRGARVTAWRDLSLLERAGLVARVHVRAWSITADGWAWLGVPAIAPRYPRKPKVMSKKERRAQRRRDAQRALAALKE